MNLQSKELNEPTDGEEIDDVGELIKCLEDLAESIPYLDPDYKILVLEECETPFIVMGPKHFTELEKKVLGLDV